MVTYPINPPTDRRPRDPEGTFEVPLHFSLLSGRDDFNIQGLGLSIRGLPRIGKDRNSHPPCEARRPAGEPLDREQVGRRYPKGRVNLEYLRVLPWGAGWLSGR